MRDVAPILLMLMALIAALGAKALVAAAREHVRRMHPDWYDQLAGSGSRFRLGGPEERVRRRIAGPLLWGRFPPGPAEDAMLRDLARKLRWTLGATALCVGGVVLIMALRSADA